MRVVQNYPVKFIDCSVYDTVIMVIVRDINILDPSCMIVSKLMTINW